ncbi:hypothetical protein NXS08_02650 [Gleimia sp. 6138-11-ORH1]|uniref:shikimate dehydrogenase family protein n=1 Tax=Gleimia sp. 6138-11-ORH1 TaxID=2973937 RepID=UPI002167C441|nr:hypothetical protein [Gleimia sp. 6138-11-ORH1]MCS4484390.1 hypothetical protein [Gleimia sp. 6138-11-ORH1]
MPQKVQLIGSPVKHSLSPAIHNAAYQALQLPYEFSVYDLPTEQISRYFKEETPEVSALAVTAPHKHQILPYLDAIEPMASTLSVVNTVVFSANIATGFNTDVYGIRQALLEAPTALTKLAETSPHLVIVGAGATAISAMMAGAELGVKKQSVIARSFHKPPSIIKIAASLGIEIQAIPLKQNKLVEKTLQTAELVISTIPSAEFTRLALLLEQSLLEPLVLEADYAQVSPLGREKLAATDSYINGTRLLLHQAIQQFSLHTGQTAPVEIMEAALRKALKKQGAAPFLFERT